MDKKALLDTLCAVFYRDGDDNLANLVEMCAADSHSVELSIDGEPCAWAFWERKGQNTHDFEPSTYGKYINYNTKKTKEMMSDDDIYLSLIAVSPKHQGKGIGKDIVELVYRQSGCAGSIYLWADKTCNSTFYERIGFEKAGEFDSPYLGATSIFRKPTKRGV